MLERSGSFDGSWLWGEKLIMPPAAGSASPAPMGLDFIHDVTLRVAVEFARSAITIKRFMELHKGSIIELEKLAGEPLDIRANGKLVARGEAVIVNDKFGIRVTEIMTPEDMPEPGEGNGKK